MRFPLALSLGYVRDSLKSPNDSALEFKLKNLIDSGSGYIGVKVLLDGRDVTDRSTMKIGGQNATQVKPYMFVTSNYGDEVLVTIKLEGPKKRDLHKVNVICNVEMLGTYSTEFEGRV